MSDLQNNDKVEDKNTLTELRDEMSYGDYLRLKQILSSQLPKSNQHDEMLFIIIHQTSELWFKLLYHELAAAVNNLKEGDLGYTFKIISRIKEIIIQLTQTWNILSTLTPIDYLKFRNYLGHSSGFQSYGYRKVEFLLGNKNVSVLALHENDKIVYNELKDILEQPSLYDQVIAILNANGLEINIEVLNRDVTLPYQSHDSVINAWLTVYQNPQQYFQYYQLAELLVDIEELMQQWRFKHMSTVQRIIGNKNGTGGTSGVNFLKKVMNNSFFPELYEVRSRL